MHLQYVNPEARVQVAAQIAAARTGEKPVPSRSPEPAAAAPVRAAT